MVEADEVREVRSHDKNPHLTLTSDDMKTLAFIHVAIYI